MASNIQAYGACTMASGVYMLSLKNFRSRAKGLSDLLPYAALIAPDTLLTKDGTFIAAWEIRGADTESSTEDELATVSSRMNAAVRELGAEWMLHVDALRLPATGYFAPEDSHFPDRVSRLIDDTRRKTFNNGRYFTTSTFLTVCWKPSVTDARLKKLAIRDAVEKEKNFLESSLESFHKSLLNIEDGLSSVLKMDRLGTVEGRDDAGKRTRFSSLLSFIQLCLIGEEYLVRVADTPMYLDAVVGGRELVGGIAPRIGGKHMAVVALDGLPTESWPSMLAGLGALPFACRFSTRYICMDQFEAQKVVDGYRKTWAQNIYKFFDKVFNRARPRANADALSMTQDAEAAYATLQSGYIGAGYYTANIVLLDEDAATLQEKVRLVQRELMRLGFGCRLEEINALEAWLSTHPGNWFANVRRPLISTLNLADFLPLASIWTGSRTCPCPLYPKESPALFQCATDSTSPFWFNLHSGDVGHTLILGPTGAGKSTLLALIAAQFRRYRNARVIVFDNGMSMYPLCRGVGGLHYNIGGDGSPSFAPLMQVSHSPLERAWAEEWLEMLCGLQNLDMLPGHRAAIHDAMETLCGKKVDMRSLTNLFQRVQSGEVKAALKHYTLAGAMGHLLDARENNLRDNLFTVFEIEQLMNMGEKNLLPVLLYLFHRVERQITGQPTLLILDEAWRVLGHAVFREKVREWLKVMRKKNCAVVMATQSLSDAMRSSIADVLLESCLTKVFLANDKAQSDDDMRGMYRRMGLNLRQIQIISEARPKREYYVTSPEGRRLVTLALTPVELAFAGASSKEDIARVQALEAAHGEAWVDVWLQERCGNQGETYVLEKR